MIKIFPYGEAAGIVYWIDGIYKITCMNAGRYFVHYMPEGNLDFNRRADDTIYKTFADASRAVNDHKQWYRPSKTTIKQALTMQHNAMKQESEANGKQYA